MQRHWLCLAVVLALHAPHPLAAAAISAPAIAEMPADAQRVAPMVERFVEDLYSVEHVHDIDAGQAREAALRALYQSWQARLQELDASTLGLEDRIDLALFRRELAYRLEQLGFERRRIEEIAPLLPRLADLTALLEERRALAYADGRRSAALFSAMESELAALAGKIGKDAASAPVRNPAQAMRAARLLDALREDLKEWNTFYAGYDPALTWWISGPMEALDARMESYAKLLRDKVAGAEDPDTIIGDPIGREAVLAALRHELIAYTPEELIALAEKELAWCQEEMRKAAAEMGESDWRRALERVKADHPVPGEQPRLVVQLADEAVEFITSRDLVTVPELARRDWRMTMLTPEYQKQAPFFLGGEDVWVAYPTDGMSDASKRMTLRGNNRHFSRAVVHHELIPGHHLQHFMTARYQAHRELFDTPFWGEGWALYWEMLLWDQGFAQTPEQKIGMLFWRSHRAARILFSLSFHTGKMTPQQAIDLLVERVGHERDNAAAEVRRSFAGDYGPMYQAAYLLGGLQFRALHAELVGGGKMSNRLFHDSILQGGIMPVSVVRYRLRGEAPPLDLPADWKFYDFGAR